MSYSPDWSTSKLNLWAKVEFPPLNSTTYNPNAIPGESLKLDVIRFESHWAPNAIPRASIDVAVGRRANDLDYVSKIHTFIRRAKTMLKCQVFAYVAEVSNSRYPDKAIDRWPAQPFLAFEGYIDYTSRASERGVQGEGATIRLELIHWLADLAFSSAMARTSHPANSDAFYMVPVFEAGGAGVSAPGPSVTTYALEQLAYNHFLPWKSTNDLFGQSLLPFLLQLSLQDRIQHSQIPSIQNGTGRTTNYEAMRALQKFEPFDAKASSTLNNTPKTYKFGVPFRIRDLVPGGTTNENSTTNDAILKAFSSDIPKSISQMPALTKSIWDLLVYQASVNFGASIIPMVDRALFAPATPGYRSWWKTIYASEHDMMSVDRALIRPLRGVVIAGRSGSDTGQGSNVSGVFNGATLNDRQRQALNVGGYYENRDAGGGLIMTLDAPGWLQASAPVVQTGFPRTRPVSTAVRPALGDETPPNDWSARLRASQNLLDRYAQMAYLTEVLKGRNMIVNSRLRFDIAPGSTVRVYSLEDKFVSKQLGQSNTHVEFGMVTNMSIVMDAERCQAGTSFQLGFVRNEREVLSSNWSTARHPLWHNGWAGAPLIGYRAEFYQPEGGGRVMGDDEVNPGLIVKRDPLGVA